MPKVRNAIAASILLAGLGLADCSATNGSNEASDEVVGSYARALERYSAGDMAGAASRAEQALAASARFLPALMLLGKASLLAGDDERAVRALERALEATPKAGEASVWLARAYRSSGMSAEASEQCDVAVSADPGSVAALRLMAALALDGERIADAKACLDRAIEAAAELGMAFMDRATIRWATGDRDGALADLDAAATVLPPGSGALRAAQSLGDRIRESEP